jgi:lysophospholipase L1-like esterase
MHQFLKRLLNRRAASAYFQQQNQTGQVCPRSKLTSRNSGNLDRPFPLHGNWAKLVTSFSVSHLLRFAAALALISIYASAFSADAQVAPEIASTSASAPITPTPTLRAPVMPGGTPLVASNAPAVGRFEQEVTSLENRRIEFSQSPIIFYGSSSIRRWKTLSQDFVGYPVVNCGFGGSRLTDCVRYVSRLVLRLKPAAVVLYAGDNDLAQGARPEQAFASFRDLFAALRRYSEKMPIAYISVKPCPARIRYIENIIRFNQMVQAFLQTQPATQYIDIYTAMLGPDHKPKPALFVQDQIHLSDLGYQVLRRDVSSFLTSELHPSSSRANILDLNSSMEAIRTTPPNH